MSYEQAMEAAGATVHQYESFGSYQGDWWAHVTYNGTTGFVTGSYGSCSGCDAFQAEFGWDDKKETDYPQRLAAFGAEYLDNIMTYDQAVTEASRNVDWDLDAEEMVNWIKATGGE